MKRKLFYVALASVVLFFVITSCTREVKGKPLTFTKQCQHAPKEAIAIIKNNESGAITDIWRLPSINHISTLSSTEIVFQGNNQKEYKISGDWKIVHNSDSNSLYKYSEYHLKTNGMPYDEFVKLPRI